MPYVRAQLRHVKRLDIVWDDYFQTSLKATTRGNRGTGVQRQVASNNQLPRNWKEFLRTDENKRELFKFLADCIASVEVEKQIISIYGKEVKSILPRDNTSSLAPCTHEDADTRMLLHVQDAVQQGYEKVVIRTFDTDVLVLAVAIFQQLWVAFVTGTQLRYIATHEIS